ncbi:Flp family type IVb pilin [Hyphomicrobium sp. MC8b]|uniref:Flp family type IVb pilin n=1 Tax=Hyphomicrobium sp. MC8b TaxID=300273 RepID=UPI00391C7334
MGSVMLRNKAFRFIADESGATAIEYALIASIISICMAAALTQISGSLQSTFNTVGTQLNANGQ